MKQEVNPVMIAGAVIVLLLVVGLMAWKNLGKSGSGPNPYKSANAPKGMKPGEPPGGSPYLNGRVSGAPPRPAGQ